MRRLQLLVLLFTLSIGTSTLYAQQSTIDSLGSVLQRQLPDSVQVDVLNELARHFGSVNTDTALSLSQQALERATQLNYRRGIAWAHASFGNVYWYTADDELGLQSYLTSLGIAEEIGDSVLLNRIYHGLGILEHARGEVPKSIEYLENALAIAYKLNLEQRQTHSELSLGVVHHSQGNVEAAIIHVQTSLAISERIGYKTGITTALNMIARIYYRQDRFTEAIPHLIRSAAVSKESGNNVRYADALTHLGRNYTRLGLFSQARASLDEAVVISQKSGAVSYEQNAYEKLYELDTAEHKYELALEHFIKSAALNDSIYNADNARHINELTAKYEADKRERDIALQQNRIELLEKDQQIKAVWRNALIGGLAFVLIAGTLLFRSQKQKMLERKKSVETELENSNLKAKQLETELDLKNKELTSYTINFIRKRELFENLENQLKELQRGSNPQFGEEIRSLNRLITENNNIDKDWEDFKMYFENVHKDFFSKLKQLHPTLGSAELRLCSLIKMNMNVKETAAILGISPDSVKTARYRLRKKFGLEGEESLSDYIINLDSTLKQTMQN